jgi:hypothetical protein
MKEFTNIKSAGYVFNRCHVSKSDIGDSACFTGSQYIKGHRNTVISTHIHYTKHEFNTICQDDDKDYSIFWIALLFLVIFIFTLLHFAQKADK